MKRFFKFLEPILTAFLITISIILILGFVIIN